MENQCVGLAEAMGLKPVVKRIRLRRLWRELSPYLLLGKAMAFNSKGDAVNPPWPDMVIATGRQSVLPALHIKEQSRGKTFLVQLQNPVVQLQEFDVVIAPEHDQLQGKNVIAPQGALHRLAPAMLEKEAAKWAPAFAHLPRPYVAVLLGGTNASYRLDPSVTMQIGPQLAAFSKNEKASLLVTPSRRTGEDNRVLLSALLHDCPASIWNEKGDNPYYGMVGLADAFIVTNDSINMISEACSTGKPVYMLKLPGHSDKFDLFHQAMLRSNRIRLFDGKLEQWHYAPLDEMSRIAALVAERFLAKKAG